MHNGHNLDATLFSYERPIFLKGNPFKKMEVLKSTVPARIEMEHHRVYDTSLKASIGVPRPTNVF
mgnify:CR=1